MGLHNIFVVDIDGPQHGYSRLGSDVFVFEWARVNTDNGDHNWCHFNRIIKTPELMPYASACKHWQHGGFNTNYVTNANEGADKMCLGTSTWSTGEMWVGIGTTCAAWIASNGWKLPRNYPLTTFSQKPAGFKRP